MKRVAKKSKKIQTNGIVIKTINVNESNRLLVILTDSLGVITAFAGGVRKPNNKNGGACGLFVYSSFILTETDGKYKVEEAFAKERFYDLRFDVTKVALSSYFCEILSVLIPEGTIAPEFIPCLLNALYLVTEGKKPLLQIKAVTEMQFMVLAGFMPNLEGFMCEHNENPCFSYIDGGIVCDKCAKMQIGFKGHRLNKTLLDSLKFITESDSKKVYNFSIPEKDLEMLSNICENFVIEQIEYRCKTLDGFKQLY